ncbi:excinuclease ABC subunit A [Desulfopila sp. IMCC35008]|uniref:excinuclease ABC subunit A n=1 Tax=Desulfopila sp. IMCC35008 TaxID=2653858 RepID=UPI0013D6DC1B|nr:excinuclease ABC subunit A [Desulfopila sp. IMCC35008]
MGRVFAVALAILFMSVALASAADVKKKFTLESAKANSDVQDVLNGDITIYWGTQAHPQVEKELGVYKTSKRTNGFMKAEEEACSHALASALIVFQERARKEGGNAVIGLQSNIKNQAESSETEYSCLIGSMMVNVALKGKVVKLKK